MYCRFSSWSNFIVIKIEVVVSEKNLSDTLIQEDIPGQVNFWWLGQAGFAFKFSGDLVLIDPYLSDSLAEKYRHAEFKHERMQTIPIYPEQITNCDWYLCTHGHTDHMDPVTIEGLQVNSDPVFVIPKAESEKGLERGIPQKDLITINAGEQITLDPLLTIKAIPSAHESFRLDQEGNHYFLGYVIDFQGSRFYHSGDSLVYSGLADELRSLDIHLAFLPVNGRDEYRRTRGVPGNMTFDESIDLCKASGIPHLICHHFGMFSFNTVDPEDLQKHIGEKANGLDILIPKIGETYTVWLNGIDEKGER